MKRTLTAALIAATALSAGAAVAQSATSGETVIIERYAGGMEVPADLSRTDVDGLLNIIYGGDSEGEKRSSVQHFLETAQ